MYLPDPVLACIDALEAAGYPAYVVGGCVRDACLGLTPHDYDMCTAALPEQTESVFAGLPLVLSGKKHGTVGVVSGGQVVEITTFRTEGSYRDNRHPEWVEFVPDIEQDLARRDFTVNAMAWSPYRGFADPFGGREDLEHNLLRAVGDPVRRFREDSLRILRGIRFAARFGMTVDTETEQAMFSQRHLMDNLARERVFSELCSILPRITSADLLRFAPVLTQVIPELAPLVGRDQKNRHHIHDLYAHTALVVEHCPPELSLRWAALLHDIGKIPCQTMGPDGQAHYYGHAAKSAEMADDILHRLKAPTALRQQAVILIEKHMTLPLPEKKYLRRHLGKLGWETMDALLTLQEADTLATGTAHAAELALFAQVRSLLAEIRRENACLTLRDLALNGHDLTALGYRGREIGTALNHLLNLVLEEQCENTREALTAALKEKSP
ncbi:MAG: CCA tRNA nucleotidyltransferase [Oscillospiraceae bacterium]|nr:CCA tRNA nucleotidyltransferase [Oscillospiraceae bacterium]